MPSIFYSIRVFSNELTLRVRWPKYWSFSFNINSSNEYLRLLSLRTDWFELLCRLKRVFSSTTIQTHPLFRAQPSLWSNSHILTWLLEYYIVCVLVAQLCLTLCDPINFGPPDPSVCGILQARILERVAVPFSRGSFQPRDRTWVSCIMGRFFAIWATRNSPHKGLPTNLWAKFVVVQPLSHVWLWDPMKCSTAGYPVLHYLPEFAQTHVHWVGDAIPLSHPLSTPSPLALNLSQHQGLFQWVGSLHQGPKDWSSSFSFSISPSNEYSGLISFRTDWFDLLAVQGRMLMKGMLLAKSPMNVFQELVVVSIITHILFKWIPCHNLDTFSESYSSFQSALLFLPSGVWGPLLTGGAFLWDLWAEANEKAPW